MTKKAMVDLYKEGIIPHIQVHDELDISVNNNEDKIKEIMESAVDLEVPNKVDYESGPNWGQIK
jgi:DNA polymerase I-like protein with 3'-5' exonuclease and polymerase domains